MKTETSVSRVQIRAAGGSTVVVELGGLRLITDPTFDPPSPGGDGHPHRLTRPAFGVADLGTVDVALVSHDQHPDNLDTAGRALLDDIALTVTSVEGAGRLGGRARGLRPYEHLDVSRPDGADLRITALPALHGPEGAEATSGPVVGFLLSGDDVPSVYVSGDNASLDVVREIRERVGAVDVALLFAGAARVSALSGGAPLTLTSADAVEAARVLGARVVVPVHCDGWSHYTEDRAVLARTFTSAGLYHVLLDAPAGQLVRL